MKSNNLVITRSLELIAAFILLVSTLSMASACLIIYNQPKVPEALLKLRKM